MQKQSISFKIKKAKQNDVLLHLTNCSDSFVPPLITRINLNDYSEKIFKNAVTFEAWKDDELIGLIAIYFNMENHYGFITNVSVIKKYSGAGLASELLKMCLEYAINHNSTELKLEVNKDNIIALNFYKKHNFTQISLENDSLIMNRIMNQKKISKP